MARWENSKMKKSEHERLNGFLQGNMKHYNKTYLDFDEEDEDAIGEMEQVYEGGSTYVFKHWLVWSSLLV